MSIQAGTFYYVEWPHTDSSPGADGGFATKHRPAIAITGADEQGDVTLLKVTGSPHYPRAVAFTQKDLTSGILKKDSYIRTDRYLTVHQSQLHEWGSSLATHKLKECYRQLALTGTRHYSTLAHAANRPGGDPAHPPFTPGQTIPYAGRVFTEDEVEAAVSSTLDFWLTLGPEGEAMEMELAGFMGVKHSLLVNSGSSANLVAISALTTHKLPANKRLLPGDEIITVAAGFPTTVAPIIQCGAVPVFIDANPLTGNADCSLLEAAYSPGKTKAVMMAHALGNPFDLAVVLGFCQKHDLWLIEDNCDALGCTYTLPLEQVKALGLDHLIKIAEKGGHPIIKIEPLNSRNDANGDEGSSNHSCASRDSRLSSEFSSDLRPSTFRPSDSPPLYLTAPTGSFGDISTQSFYPPHHLTMGEGGAVNIIRKPALKTYAESFRDWGRDCWCASGQDDTCNKRFQWQLGELPEGYDHKYIYSHLGYNLKPLDIQAAIGRVQLKRLPDFIEARKHNWEQLRRGLHGLEDYIDFALPTHATAWNPPRDRAQETEIEQPLNSLNDANEDFCSSNLSRDSRFSRLVSTFSWDSSGCRTDCSWFGFMMTIKDSAPFTRTELAQELDRQKIGNRMLFGGNLIRQPAFVQLKRDNPDAFRVVSSPSTFDLRPSTLCGADRIMNHTLFLGTYPGLTREQIDYIIKVIRNFIQTRIASKA
jgi:CDP-6-deoxy-D-xylo-4-hexulose-3-dehydrase